jgi:hypothetical protein
MRLRRAGVGLSAAGPVLGLLIVAGSVAISSFVLDTSYDGQVYHMLAVKAIRDGYNPLYEPIYPASPWVSHYPKASWLMAAFIYTYVPLIDAGKAINLVGMAAAFLSAQKLIVQLLVSHRSYASWVPVSAALLSAAIAANPVVMAQLFTYYNDGLLGSMLLAYIVALWYFYFAREIKAFILSLMTAVILINLKFTGVIYVIGFAVMFILVQIYRISTGRSDYWQSCIYLSLLGASILIGLAVIGYNPYITNSILRGHPFYPVEGVSRIDIITANMPEDFVGKPWWEKLYLSVTGRVGNQFRPQSSERREGPLDVSPEEFRNVYNDTRVAGFGPYMHLLLLGALLVLATTVAADRRSAFVGWVMSLPVVGTVIINPESWWARYVPQLWWLPSFAVLAAWVTPVKVVRLLGWLLLALILWNAGGSGTWAVLNQVRASNDLKEQLTSVVQTSHQLKIFQEGSGFVSVPVRVRELGGDYLIVTNVNNCLKLQSIRYSTARICD